MIEGSVLAARTAALLVALVAIAPARPAGAVERTAGSFGSESPEKEEERKAARMAPPKDAWDFVAPLHHESFPGLGPIPGAVPSKELYTVLAFHGNWFHDELCIFTFCQDVDARFRAFRWSFGVDWAIGEHTGASFDFPFLWAWDSDAEPGDWNEHGIDLGNARLGLRYAFEIPLGKYRLYITPGLRASFPTDTWSVDPDKEETVTSGFMPDVVIEPGVTAAAKIGRFSPFIYLAVPILLNCDEWDGDGWEWDCSDQNADDEYVDVGTLIQFGFGAGVAILKQLEASLAFRVVNDVDRDLDVSTISMVLGARYWFGAFGAEIGIAVTLFGDDDILSGKLDRLFAGDFALSLAGMWRSD